MDKKQQPIPTVPVRKPNAVPPKTPTIQKFKNGSKPNVRLESFNERLERLHYEHDNGPKPAHYDNPNIVDYENINQKPKPFRNDDPSTYLSNRDQKQRSAYWGQIMSSANTPEEKKEVREILKQKYKSIPQSLDDKELKMIGKHPSQQIKLDEIKPIDPVIQPIEQKPIIPERSVEEIINERAKKKLAQEQEAYDREYGRFGIVDLFRPE